MTTWVKACGLGTVGDVEVAVSSGADAVGFVLASSPRQVGVELACQLVKASGDTVAVLLTVDSTVEEAAALAEATGAGGLQPYGLHSAEVIAWAIDRGLLVLQPIPVGIDQIGGVTVQAGAMPLFDTALADRHGGGGRPFDWNLVAGYRDPFVLAGGLNPQNVRAAVTATGAWGVDASSGLESSPGIKDHAKIRAFIEGAKRS